METIDNNNSRSRIALHASISLCCCKKKRMRFRADLYQIPFTLLSPSKNTILSWSLHRSVVSSQPVIQINPSTSGISLEIGV